MPFEITDDVRIDRDPDGRVVLIDHLAQPVIAVPPTEDVDALNADTWCRSSGYATLNWRAFLEPAIGAVVYLRAFVA